MTRDDLVRSLFDTSGYGLEVGPSYNPILSKALGYRVDTLDYMDKAGLIEKYTAIGGVNVDKIEDVTYVSDGRPMHQIIGKSGIYDFIVASHVIEHTPNLIGFLRDCETLLKSDGVLVLVVPDKRYCFDYFRPLSTLGQVIYAHKENKVRVQHSSVFDHNNLYCTRSNIVAWDSLQDSKIVLQEQLERAHIEFLKSLSEPEYIDVHNWVFTPSSFRYILKSLEFLKYISIKESSLHLTANFEFFITLSKSGGGCQISDLDLNLNTVAELKDVRLDSYEDRALPVSMSEEIREMRREILQLRRMIEAQN